MGFKRTWCYIIAVLWGISLVFTTCCNKQQLPIIRINTDTVVSKAIKKACTISYESNCWRGSFTSAAKIKRRGGVSISQPKRSYTFKLAEHYALGGMPSNNDWVLNASYIDKTLMRHKISYELYRSMHPKNKAAKCAYVSVFLNEEYQGVYVLMERMDASRLLPDKKNKQAAIFKEPPIFYKGGLKKKYIQDTLNYYHQKFPKPKKVDKYEEMDSLFCLLFDKPDSLFLHPEKGITQWFDIDNVIDWHLLLLFTNNADGILKNFYLYKQNERTPYRFVIWDYDHSFGRDGDGAYNMLKNNLRCERSPLIKRLLATNGFDYKNRLKKRWQELKQQNILTEANVNRLIDENLAQLQLHYPKNFERWPYKAKHYRDENTFEQEVAIIREYVSKRVAWVDAFLEGI